MRGFGLGRARHVVVLFGVVGALVGGVTQAASASGAAGSSSASAVWSRTGDAPVVPAHSVDLGALAATTPLQLSVLLSPRDPAALAAYAKAVSDPASPAFRHFLAPGQFAKVFGPTQASIKSITNALRKRGLHPGPVSGNGLDIPITTTARAAESALSVTLRNYKLPNGRHAFANTAAPTVPNIAGTAVQGIVGLDNLNPPKPASLSGHPAAAGSAVPNVTGTGGGPSSCASAQNGGATAEQLAQAYGFNNLYSQGDQGAGATVALFELSGYDSNDLATLNTCYGITPNVTNISVTGGGGINGGVGEVMLDIDVVVELAPQAHLLVYEGGPYMDVWNQIVSDDSAPVVSTSWVGGCEPSATVQGAENTVLQQAAVQGQTVFAATGDGGSEDCTQGNPSGSTALAVQDPGSQPFITGVGGTNISAYGPAPTETGWSGSTGGISIFWQMPSYQSGPGVNNSYTSGTPCSAPSGTNCREVPDVSALSGSPGYSVYCTAGGVSGCNNGGWVRFFGTSGAAPLWAAFAAVTNAGCSSDNIGFINPLLYQLAAAAKGAGPGYFNDVTTGNNDQLGIHAGAYPATTAYDMVTGLGTPIGVPLAGALCHNPLVTVTVTGTETIGGSVSFSYTPGALPSGVTGVTGPLIDCKSTVTATTAVGTYSNTISACQGLALNGPNAANYEISYVDGGVTVNKAPSTTVVTSTLNPSVFGQPVTYTATVTSQAPGGPTGTVHFFDGVTPLASGSLAGGTFSTTDPEPAVGTHHISAVYDGDASDFGSTGTMDQVVNKAPTTTTLTFTPPNPTVNQAVTFTAVVTPIPANVVLPTGTVAFYIDGSSTPAATVALSGGQAVFITTFGGGAHTVVAVYSGDGNFLGSTSAAATPTVLCTTTITGAHSSLSVTSGTTCVSNANITGGISVAKGAVLDIENSTVSGSISANAPLTLRICGSHTGSISVSGATGFVLIGDPANNCPANTISGGITAANNKGGLVIIGNTVSGAITAAGNSGAGPLPGQTTPIISGNHH